MMGEDVVLVPVRQLSEIQDELRILRAFIVEVRDGVKAHIDALTERMGRYDHGPPLIVLREELKSSIDRLESRIYGESERIHEEIDDLDKELRRRIRYMGRDQP